MPRAASDVFTEVFTPLIGLPCWGARRVYGSMVSFEFGAPHLTIREPSVSTSSSARVRKISAQRMVRPAGEWYLAIESCDWSIASSGALVVDHACRHEAIEAAIDDIDGQKLTSVAIDAKSFRTAFTFDLGTVLTTWPWDDEDETADQWWLLQPDGHCLSYGTDGGWFLGPGNTKPGTEVWTAITEDVRIP